jgi:hypothetical protein
LFIKTSTAGAPGLDSEIWETTNLNPPERPEDSRPRLQIISHPFGRVGMEIAVEYRLAGGKKGLTPHPPCLWKSFFNHFISYNLHVINNLHFRTVNESVTENPVFCPFFGPFWGKNGSKRPKYFIFNSLVPVPCTLSPCAFFPLPRCRLATA